MNEGGCDPDGRFYCGSMAYDKRPGAGKLYRLDPDGSVRVVLEGVTISNGLDWSPDGSLAYYNDTRHVRRRRLRLRRRDRAQRRRRFVDLRRGAARRADGGRRGRRLGRAVDGGAVRRYTPEGDARRGRRGARQRRSPRARSAGRASTSCSSPPRGRARARRAEPLAGALFRAEVGVTGLPVREFAG